MQDEKFKPQEQLSYVDEAKRVITTASDRIEEEFEKTKNTWMDCFGSSIFVVETYLGSNKGITELGNKFTKINQNLEKLKERYFELKKLYPDKNNIPPDEIKQELLSILNVLE